jgi:hypothetical protein
MGFSIVKLDYRQGILAASEQASVQHHRAYLF